MVAAYSCLEGSQVSTQLRGRPPGPHLAKRGCADWGGERDERKFGLLSELVDNSERATMQKKSYFALRVGPNANRAKLLGKSGFPGERSPTGSYARSLSLSPKSDPAEW